MLTLHWVASKKSKRAQQAESDDEEEDAPKQCTLDIMTGIWNFIRALLFALNIVVGGFFVALLWGKATVMPSGLVTSAAKNMSNT